MCNTFNTGYNCYNARSGCNACGSCWNNGQRVCRDVCGNLRVYSCYPCTCNQSECGYNGVSTGNNGNTNGYGCVTVCGNVFNTAQATTADTTNGIYYPRYYGYRGRGCGCGCYNN